MTIEINEIKTHPGTVKVIRGNGEFDSWAIADKDIMIDETLSHLDDITYSKCAYTSVQVSEVDHVELNSDLVFINHSCDPNVAFDVSSGDKSNWRLKALKSIRKGESLEFFYPSTEWSMSQPFDCLCNKSQCLKRISGAKDIELNKLKGYFINDHILRLKHL